MSSSEGHVTSARKRKDKKKSRHHRADRSGGSQPIISKLIEDENDNDDDDDDDIDEDDEDKEITHDHPADITSSNYHRVGCVSCVCFILLLSGLIALGVLIFVGLKDSNKEVSTPINESRYASILSNFIEEHDLEHDIGDGHEDDDDIESSLLRHDDSHEADEEEHLTEEEHLDEEEIDDVDIWSEPFETPDDPMVSQDESLDLDVTQWVQDTQLPDMDESTNVLEYQGVQEDIESLSPDMSPMIEQTEDSYTTDNDNDQTAVEQEEPTELNQDDIHPDLDAQLNEADREIDNDPQIL